LLSVAVGFVFFAAFLAIGPGLISSAIRSSVTTTPPPGVSWTLADAETCLATAQALSAWPDDDGGPVTRLGLGISDDVVEARAIAVQSGVDFARMADRLRPPGAEAELAALRDEFATAAQAFGQPITVTAFREKYHAIGSASRALTARCRAVGRWVDDNYEQ
jgi:hypothetical protein